MRTATFLRFVAPSALTMFALIAVPLAGVAWLAVHGSHVETELVEVTTEVPMFGGVTRVQTKIVPQPVLDENGEPITVNEFVGLAEIRSALDVDGLGRAFAREREDMAPLAAASSLYDDVTNLDFWGALEFTLLYTFGTTPFVLGFGLLLALAVNRAARRIRSTLVFATLLPMIITPVVAALSLYWLFVDDAVISSLLQAMGFGRLHFLGSEWTIRSIILFFGVWSATPFAFILLYAGLQTVPQETLEAARVDGASRWQTVRAVVIPHLAPLFAVIALIHLMDAYRVFEPIYVFGSRVFASSLQYLVFFVLAFQDNVHRAAAYAILTVIGVILLLAPVVWSTWRHQGGSGS